MSMGASPCTGDDVLQPGDKAINGVVSPRRDQYPTPREAPYNANFLGVVTKLIKNGELSSFISKGVYPSPLHEALSELQRKGESATVYPLLDLAAKEPKGSEMRLFYVSVYNVTCWHEQRTRMSYKPVKPLQNETFEYVDPEGNFKLLVEEVLQNREKGQYVTCWKAWGKHWSLQYEMIPKIKFSIMTGPCLEFSSNCIGEIKFPDGDTYTTSLAPGLITSLASNPQVFSYKGISYATCTSTGLTCEADLTEPSMLSMGKKHRVKGVLTNKGQKVSDLELGGRWDEKFIVTRKGTKEETAIWQKDTAPRPTCRYALSRIGIHSNALTKELAGVLPPTDSRLRSDVRAIEQGDYRKADAELQRIQALNEKAFSKGEDVECKGVWFSSASDPDSYLKYRYKGGYWEARAAKATGDSQAWSACPDIYDLGAKRNDVSDLMASMAL